MKNPHPVQCACGGTPVRRIRDSGPTSMYSKWIECQKCGIKTAVLYTDNFDDTLHVHAWNKMQHDTKGFASINGIRFKIDM